MKTLIKQTLLLACLLLFTQCGPSKEEIGDFKALQNCAKEFSSNNYQKGQYVLFEDMHQHIDTFVCEAITENLAYESHKDIPQNDYVSQIGVCYVSLIHIPDEWELAIQIDLYASRPPYDNIRCCVNFFPHRGSFQDFITTVAMLRLPIPEDTIVCKQQRVEENPMYAIVKNGAGLIEWGYEDGNKWKLVE